ncbi:MAG: hypothetical protein QW607_07835 [Desulfurococcaceae archaeon]
MIKYEVKSLNDLEGLVDRLYTLLVKSDLSINEIKEKSRLITYFSNLSEFSIKLSELIELYQKDKKHAYHYVFEKLKLKDEIKQKISKEFKDVYGDVIYVVEENENSVNVEDVVNEVSKEVSKTSLIKLENEDDIKEIEEVVSLNEEERVFIRKNTIETSYFIQVKFKNDTATELKFNKDVYTLTINPKSLIIFHEDFIDKYQYDIEIDKEYFKERNQYITEFNEEFLKRILEQGYRNILFIKQGKKLFRFTELSLKDFILSKSELSDIYNKMVDSKLTYTKFINEVNVYILGIQEKMQIEIEDFILSKDRIMISSVDIEDKKEFEDVIKNGFFQEVEAYRNSYVESNYDTSMQLQKENISNYYESNENEKVNNDLNLDIAKLKEMFGRKRKRK